jgi:hypothetical protein
MPTPYVLGCFVDNPEDAGSAAALADFTSLMGAPPVILNAYLDYTQPQPLSGSNSYSVGEFSSTPGWQTTTPMIALPMGSSYAGAPSAQTILGNFVSGAYDAALQGMVSGWANAGYKTQYWRPGVEMNLSSTPGFVGSDASLQAQWIAAFRHIYTVMHAQAAAIGVTLFVIWNPGITNDTAAGKATVTLWPGAAYVDIIGADVYGDLYPFGAPNQIYDWSKSGQVLNSPNPVFSNLVTFASDPVNLEHYYSYPASTESSLDASGGSCLSLAELISFAAAQGKPIAICETGAGASGDGAGLTDNPTFVSWLASTLGASTADVAFVSIWDSNGGGEYAFTPVATAGKPKEAAAWAQYFGAAAQPQVAHAPSAAGTQVNGAGGTIYDDEGNAWNITSAAQIARNGVVVSSSAGVVTLFWTGTQLDQLNSAGVWWTQPLDGSAGVELIMPPIGWIMSTTALAQSVFTIVLSADLYDGDSQASIAVDGKLVATGVSVSAVHNWGEWQAFTFAGSYGAGSHTVEVTFLNDAYAGTPATDRNLYVDYVEVDGVRFGTPASLFSTGATAAIAVKTLY